jgi:hypothetical protein
VHVEPALVGVERDQRAEVAAAFASVRRQDHQALLELVRPDQHFVDAGLSRVEEPKRVRQVVDLADR